MTVLTIVDVVQLWSWSGTVGVALCSAPCVQAPPAAPDTLPVPLRFFPYLKQYRSAVYHFP